MHITTDTKVVARFHTKPSPRGLNIYNPFFEEANLNAVYLLFFNPDPAPLISAMRGFNLAGAITAGFESDDRLPPLLDEIDDVSAYTGKVGFITNQNGKLIGSSQGGQGLLQSVLKSGPIEGKKLVLVGSGNIARGFLFNIKKQFVNPPEVILVNRTVEKALSIQKDFPFVIAVKPVTDLVIQVGDILVNATNLGGSQTDDVYTESIVNNFQTIVDVTFESENTNLVNLAKKLNKKLSTGWDMFAYQGQVILETIFQTTIDINLFRKHVINGLSKVVS